jgi:hypothetical protein
MTLRQFILSAGDHLQDYSFLQLYPATPGSDIAKFIAYLISERLESEERHRVASRKLRRIYAEYLLKF